MRKLCALLSTLACNLPVAPWLPDSALAKCSGTLPSTGPRGWGWGWLGASQKRPTWQTGLGVSCSGSRPFPTEEPKSMAWIEHQDHAPEVCEFLEERCGRAQWERGRTVSLWGGHTSRGSLCSGDLQLACLVPTTHGPRDVLLFSLPSSCR